jgi:transposase
VSVSRFGDHLPLYRLEDILARAGVYLAHSTLRDCVKYAAELFALLHELQRQSAKRNGSSWQ